MMIAYDAAMNKLRDVLNRDFRGIVEPFLPHAGCDQ